MLFKYPDADQAVLTASGESYAISEMQSQQRNNKRPHSASLTPQKRKRQGGDDLSKSNEVSSGNDSPKGDNDGWGLLNEWDDTNDSDGVVVISDDSGDDEPLMARHKASSSRTTSGNVSADNSEVSCTCSKCSKRRRSYSRGDANEPIIL